MHIGPTRLEKPLTTVSSHLCTLQPDLSYFVLAVWIFSAVADICSSIPA